VERQTENKNTPYLTKGGLPQIAETSQCAGDDGTASFGGARSVRAWIGEMALVRT